MAIEPLSMVVLEDQVYLKTQGDEEGQVDLKTQGGLVVQVGEFIHLCLMFIIFVSWLRLVVVLITVLLIKEVTN
jgi:hypothetical protein